MFTDHVIFVVNDVILIYCEKTLLKINKYQYRIGKKCINKRFARDKTAQTWMMQLSPERC